MTEIKSVLGSVQVDKNKPDPGLRACAKVLRTVTDQYAAFRSIAMLANEGLNDWRLLRWPSLDTLEVR